MTDVDKPKPRKVLITLTDAEWRALRVAAAEDDTTIQGWMTTTALAALQARHPERRGV